MKTDKYLNFDSMSLKLSAKNSDDMLEIKILPTIVADLDAFLVELKDQKYDEKRTRKEVIPFMESENRLDALAESIAKFKDELALLIRTDEQCRIDEYTAISLAKFFHLEDGKLEAELVELYNH